MFLVLEEQSIIYLLWLIKIGKVIMKHILFGAEEDIWEQNILEKMKQRFQFILLQNPETLEEIIKGIDILQAELKLGNGRYLKLFSGSL